MKEFFKPEDFTGYMDVFVAHEAAKIANAKRDEAMREAKATIKIYADPNNWRDTWKDSGNESDDFKYFYRLGHSTKDMEKIKEPFHYCMGKQARLWLKKHGGEK